MPIPLPVIPNVFRCALNWREGVTSMTAENVIHIKASASGATQTDAFNALNANVTQAMWGPVESAAVVNSVTVTPLDGTSASVTFASSGLKWTGQASSGQFEPAVSGIIKLTTNFRGRANRGRVYLPFLATSGLGDGSISGSVPTTTTAAWSTFMAALIANTPSFTLEVASYDRAHSGAGAHSHAVLVAALESLVGTQRRRQSRLRGG